MNRYTVVIVRTLFEKLVVNCRRGELAGPFKTDPDVLYCDPWQGHSNT